MNTIIIRTVTKLVCGLSLSIALENGDYKDCLLNP